MWAFARAGGGDAAPDAAARIVPGNALVYLHVSTDRGRAGTRQALKLLQRFPSSRSVRASLLNGLRRFGRGTGVDFRRDIEPWLGDEVAVALLTARGSATAAAEFVVGVRDRAEAEGFLLRLGRPSGSTEYKGVAIRAYGAQALAFVGRFLVAGSPSAVRATVDAAKDRGRSLAGSPIYRAARAGAPPGRAADLYVTGSGVARILSPRSGFLGVLGTVLSEPGLLATDISLSATGDVARLRVHSVRRQGQATALGGLPFRAFVPTLTTAFPGPALAFADVGGLDRALQRFAAALPAAADRIRRDLAPVLGGEVAVGLLPRGGTAPPVLLAVAPVADEAKARRALAQAQGPLIELLTPTAGKTGQTPSFGSRPLGGGVTAFRLRVNPDFEIDYAVFGNRIVITTDLAAIAALRHTGVRVADQQGFHDVIATGRGPVTSLVFLDFQKLLDFGERTGLAQDSRYLAVRDDLRRIHAVGLRSSAGETDSTAEIFFQIP